jgi:Leucine-rich repeat (LRR) protein
MKDYAWPTLEEIYLDKNMISNIDVLGRYPMLKKIDASNNFIEEVNLYLPRLESLDLHNNYLKKFPILEGMHRLRHLNLKGNQLADFREVLIDFTPKIQTLDIEGNEISFESVAGFEDFLQKLRGLTHLRSLHVAENPFFRPDRLKMFPGINVKEELINQLRNLDTFNGDGMRSVEK